MPEPRRYGKAPARGGTSWRRGHFTLSGLAPECRTRV